MPEPRYRVTKTFGHERGYSCAFRQHAAKSHCRLLHGYALAFDFHIGSTLLDENGWCFDFGGFTGVKEFLDKHFDHTVLVAADDPKFSTFTHMHEIGAARIVALPRVGCEAFAKFTHEMCVNLILAASIGRANLISVTVREHGANAVTYTPPNEFPI